MENITGKRRGRPRKIVDLSNAAKEGARAFAEHFRNREAGKSGDRAPEQITASGPSWEELVTRITDNKSWKHSVAMAFHPEPKDDYIKTVCGFVRVMKGPAGYTLNTGETVNLAKDNGV
jgi:hypothetical protein